MIKYIIKNFYLKFYINVFNKKFNFKNYDLNFKNIQFVDNKYLKKIFLSDKFYYKKYTDENSYGYHSFEWLNTAKNMGSAENVSKAKKHIINWKNKKYSKNLYIWKNSFASKRFLNLIYNYDFYAVSASNKEKDFFHEVILEHYLFIYFALKNNKHNSSKIEECKALILGSLIYDKNIDFSLKFLTSLMKVQIDDNGFNVSYNPLYQAEFLNDLYEIKNMMLFFTKPVPEKLSFEILNMSSLLKSLMHKDDSLALFNGSNNFYNEQIYKLIKLEQDIKEKNFYKLDKGIVIYKDKDKKLFFDIVFPTNKIINSNLHSGTLSFEFSCLNEKIITNCGSVKKGIGKKPEYLRYSAAHSTIILNNTNIIELLEKKAYRRSPKTIKFESLENEDYYTWVASHDGYVNNFNKIIRRKLIISKNNFEIFGEDSIISTKTIEKKISYSIRFHLMPECNSLITNDKKSIIIKTKLNQTWVFKSTAKLSIENSIYIGDGKIVKSNKQIVITGTVDSHNKTEKWQLLKS